MSLGEREAALAVARMLIPGGARLPGADNQTLAAVEELVGAPAARVVGGLCSTLDRAAVLARGKRLVRLSPDDREALLRRWECDPVLRYLGSGDGSSFCYWQSSPGMLLGDEWQHVAVTVDRAAGTAILYVSGKAMTGSGCIVPTFPTNAPLTIGAQPGGINAAMDNLDDLRIYNTILTPGQIAALAQ